MLKTDSGTFVVDNAATADFRSSTAGREFATVLADPPWQFQNRTGKVANSRPAVLDRKSAVAASSTTKVPGSVFNIEILGDSQYQNGATASATTVYAGQQLRHVRRR